MRRRIFEGDDDEKRLSTEKFPLPLRLLQVLQRSERLSVILLQNSHNNSDGGANESFFNLHRLNKRMTGEISDGISLYEKMQ